MILQLNPSIPMSCPKGDGEAFMVIDYSKEDFTIFAIALDSNGEIWMYPSNECRFLKNITMGRTLDKETQLESKVKDIEQLRKFYDQPYV